MADITSEQFAEFIKHMRDSAGALTKLAGGNSSSGKGSTTGNSAPRRREQTVHENLSRKAAAERLKQDLKQNKLDKEQGKLSEKMAFHSGRLGESFRLLDGDSRSLGRSFVDLSKKFAAGAVIGVVLEQMIELGTHWIKSYRDMADVGQSFGGSVFKMAEQAAAAGMPLEKFSEYVTKNSKIMAAFGTKDVTMLAKHVRQMTHEVGMYGYSVEGMNEVTATWLDMQRLQGNRWAAVNSSSASSIQNFAETITELAGATGKSREAILKDTADFANSGEITAALLNNPELKNNSAFQDTMATIMAAGDTASKLIGDSFAKAALQPGRMYESGTIALMNEIGIGGPFATAMKAHVDGLKNGTKKDADFVQVIDVLKKSIRGASGTIALMAEDKPELLQLTQVLAELDSQNTEAGKANLESAKKMSAVTEFLATIGDKFAMLKGNFLEGVIKGFESVDGALTSLNNEGKFAALGKMVGELGARFGKFLANMLTWVQSDEFQAGLRTTISFLTGLGTALVWVGGLFMNLVEGLQNLVGSVAGAALAIAGVFAAKKLAGMFLNGVGRMNVTAAMVSVNGMPAGGGLPGIGGAIEGGATKGGGIMKFLKSPKGRAGLVVAAIAVAAGIGSMLMNKKDDTQEEIAKNTAQIAKNGEKANDLATDAAKEVKGESGINYAGSSSPVQFEHGRAVNATQGLTDPTPQPATNAPPKKKPGEEGGPSWGGIGMLGAVAGALGITAVARRGPPPRVRNAPTVTWRNGGLGGDAAAAEASMAKRAAAAAEAAAPIASRFAGLGGKFMKNGALGALFESFDYMKEDGKALTLKNLAKSGLTVGGGALGAALAGGSTFGVGAIAGGMAGGAAGGWLGDKIFGADDMKRDMKNTNTIAAPASPPELSSPDQIGDMRRASQILEERLPPIENQILSFEIEAKILKVLVEMRSMNEAMLVHTKNSAMANNVTTNLLREMKDKKN